MTPVPDEKLRAALEVFGRGGAEAEPVLRELCDNHPSDVRAHFLLGALLERGGRYPEALRSLERALELDSGHIQTLSAAAVVLQALQRSTDAMRLLGQAVGRLPDSGQLWANLGVLRESLGDFKAALDAYDQALSKRDAPLSARLNRGYVLTRLLRLPEALENNLLLAASHPGYADAHFNVAEALLALHRYDEALEACDRALAIEPAHPKAAIDRAMALAALGRVDEAQQILDAVKQSHPRVADEFNHGFSVRAGGALEEFDARSIHFHLTYEQFEQGQWARRDELLAFVRSWEGGAKMRPLSDQNIPFRILGLEIEPATQTAIAVGVASAIEKRATSQAGKPLLRVSRMRPRIRVGYVSPDFRIHPAAYLTRRLYRGHDRGRFEVYGYAITPDDGSWIRKELQPGFDVFRDVGVYDSVSIARMVVEDEIDILVDLAGYTNFARSEIFALRPAPLQVNWLGYPGTLGARYMDYALIDGVVCPPGVDAAWTEQLVRLPNTYFITDNNPRVDARTPTRAESGLPESGFVFCCFNNIWKIEPRIFSVWMDLLRRVPDSVLWLLAFRPEVSENLKREARARGVDPQRLVFGSRLPNEAHLTRYRLADLFLDTLYCNAHTTAIDCLREGTPVLTVPGPTLPSRVAASLLTAAGLPELICADLDAYRDKALALASNPAEQRRLRSYLLESRGKAPLFDTPRFIRNLETAFELMWDRRRQGLSPQAFDVQEKLQRRAATGWF